MTDHEPQSGDTQPEIIQRIIETLGGTPGMIGERALHENVDQPELTDFQPPQRHAKVHEPAPLPHLVIAADSHWDKPTVPEDDDISFKERLRDTLLGSAVMGTVDRLYAELAHRGVYAQPLVEGDELAVDMPGALLKVVQDLRVHPRRPTRGRRFETPDRFDAAAQAMIDNALYTGRQVAVKIDDLGGEIQIARRTLYLINSPSDAQLAGKIGDMLGRGGNEHSMEFVQRHPVGHVHRYETRKDRVERRVVSAELLRPAGPKRAPAKIIDLGALADKLIPSPNPTTA
jgi:hypothetical protein